MAEDARSKREPLTYLIAIWMIINIALMLMLLPADYLDFNNWIELALWIPSIIGLLMMKKWGIALTLFTLIYTLSTSVSILVYYQVWLNALRVIVNLAFIIYLFKHILSNKLP